MGLSKKLQVMLYLLVAVLLAYGSFYISQHILQNKHNPLQVVTKEKTSVEKKEALDCANKLDQGKQTLSQKMDNATDCLFIGCGNFFQ